MRYRLLNLFKLLFSCNFCIAAIMMPDCLKNKDADRSLFLWSLESPNLNAKSYLFGTIHVPYTQVWDYVSHTVKTAFARAESVVFELDLYDQRTVELLTRCKKLPGGHSLRDLLPPALFYRLRNYMRRFRGRLLDLVMDTSTTSREAKQRAKHLYSNIAGGWEHRRPVWLLFLLQQLGELQLNSSPSSSSHSEPTPMLDVYLAQEAQTNAKQLKSIETPDEQCNPLNRINMDQVIFAINYTLSYLEFVRDRQLEHRTRRSGGQLHDLIEQYKCGSLTPAVFSADSQRFAQIGFSLSPADDQRAQQFDQELRDEIISKRNVRMASRMDSLLMASPSTAFFFALGTGHFLGDDSILQLLQQNGYNIAPVREGDMIEILPSLAWHEARIRPLWVKERPEEIFEVSITVSGTMEHTVPDRLSLIFLIVILFYFIRI